MSASRKKKLVSAPRFRDCQAERTFNVKTGLLTSSGYVETGSHVETKACGIPLFDGDDEQHGICGSCAGGWETEGNVPTERGKAQVAAAKAAR